jgi:hypothetical protein
MFTEYQLNKKLSIEKIFDGRLERFGVHETFVAEATPEWVFMMGRNMHEGKPNPFTKLHFTGGNTL